MNGELLNTGEWCVVKRMGFGQMYQITLSETSFAGKQSMKYCFNPVWFLLFVTAGAIGGDQVSQSVDMTFAVNIVPPVCKLKNADLSIDFGEIEISDIISENVKKKATFSFTDCTNVNNVTISFSGDYVDGDKNFIKNKAGGGYASGVAIGLYDSSGKRIQLKDGKNISAGNSSSFDFPVTASVIKDSSSVAITSGKIDTSVNLNITYN
ncbi:type 1 fimbrial protein [Escherichia albertii]|uniref:fimbrial protein n=1 Tax=Escherichia albertii TaxID=208962 RepID=UPI0021D46D54|nr:fimbrial protein [Escherichia albertii]MCU7311474.1 type 1 fimbrial protein [Escherichia albertii]MCZ9159487.1 fimbrial protein [Escherichia albertii]